MKFHEEEKGMMKEVDINITHHAASGMSVKEMDYHSRTKICKEECFTNSEAFKRSAVYCVKRVLGLRFFLSDLGLLVPGANTEMMDNTAFCQI